MTMEQLSAGYAQSAQLLRKRMAELRALVRLETDPEKKWALRRRILELSPMLTQMNELTELTARYYEKGY